ncbi:MAG: hypothetical protein J6S74_03770 [Alphaproteobacteria bacterium]|nr:hypothetical protein [Alphaproteobacteria bacterium]
MPKTKRLFLVAGFDADGIIDESLNLYVRELSKMGDVVLCMDCDCNKTQTAKLKPYVLHAIAKRHDEYDFGSYKRDFIWACENLELSTYDFMYMVNDSVYGPLFPLKSYIEKMESLNTDAFGMVKNTKADHPHIQSWFIGMRPSVFLSNWFKDFICSVKPQKSKGAITHLYEHRFTKLVTEHDGTFACLYSAHNRDIYNKIKKYYKQKMPFIKRVAFTRHNGTLGPQISYVLSRTPTQMRDAIIKNAERIYGPEYTQRTLSQSKFMALVRGIKYGIQKIITGKL